MSSALFFLGGILTGLGASFTGLGGVLGAQIEPHLLENLPTAGFRQVFALVLVGLATYLSFQK